MILLGLAVAVDADDHRLAPVDRGGAGGGRLLDPALGHAAGDRVGHSAKPLDLLDQRPGLVGQLGGQRLDIIRAAERIGDVGDAALLGDDELGVAGDAGGEIGWQGDRLVERVGVQALGPAEHRRQRLQCRADHIVIGVLLGEADARRLAMGAQHQGLRVLRAEPSHDPVPEQPRRAQLRHLHEEVHADAEEEGEAWRKGVDVEPLGAGGADIVHSVGEREGELLHRRRPGLVHVIARDRDRVEPGHVRRAILDDVGDDPHRGLGRVDIGVADRELLQDVVLDRAGELGLGRPPAPPRRRCRKPAPAAPRRSSSC